MQCAQDGSGGQLDALLAAIRPSLFSYFARQVDAAAADDLAQRALVIVAREHRRIAPDRAARWLVTVARNVLRDEHRRMARAAYRYAPVRDATAIAGPDATAALAEYHELARAVVRTTNAVCTAPLRAVVLGVLRGLDVTEIARLEGISESAVRVRLSRARAVLRSNLELFHQRRPRPRPSIVAERVVNSPRAPVTE